MEPLTRRSFIVVGSLGAAGVAAGGVAGAGAIGAISGGSSSEPPPPSDEDIVRLARPALLQVRDAASGEVELLVGDREIVFTDRTLVARVLRAAQGGEHVVAP